MLVAAMQAWGTPPPKVRTPPSTIPVVLTCAGVTGVMADGRYTHYGAAAEGYRRPLPFGSVLTFQSDGTEWTIEDTTAPWVADYWRGRLHADLYNLWGRACLLFGVRYDRAAIRSR